MLVSTRMPVRLPSKEKIPTTTELRNIWRLAVMNYPDGQQRFARAERSNTVDPGDRNQYSEESSPATASSCSTTKGVETTNRNTISTGEVPKLNSKNPSTTKANQPAIAPSISHRPARQRRRTFHICQIRAVINQIQAARHGSPRSAANWMKLSCRCS